MIEREQGQELRQCLEYFQSRPVFDKLFRAVKEKYAGLGRFGGKAVLMGLSAEEKRQLGGFLQKDYTECKNVVVPIAHLEKCVSESTFSSCSLEVVICAYFDENLTVKREEVKRAKGYEILMQQYREDPENLKSLIGCVFSAIEKLPTGETENQASKRLLLPVFAAEVTGNPHYFGAGTAAEKLLLAYLEAEAPEDAATELSPAEFKNYLLYRAGILRDDLSNETLVYGIRAWKTDGRGHEGIDGFFREREPVRITLRTLGGLGKIRAGQKNVFVVENPAAFSVIIERYPDCAVVCVNGQPRLASLILLDGLKAEHTFCYSGDFDPEGLLIAQRMKERYGDRMEFWKYEVELYRKYLSGVKLGTTRLRKLDKVYLEELSGIKNCMLKERRAAYQEAMLEEQMKNLSRNYLIC